MKKKVKGFTLIELIVVMAIFGIILAAAMQLLRPMNKLVTQSSLTESGGANTGNIRTLLENEFASVEHLDCYNTTGSMDDRVLKFAKHYYEGVLRAGSTSSAPNYGSGEIHVMIIDNDLVDDTDGDGNPDTINTSIEEYVYNANFTMGAVTVTQADHIENAINMAAYNSFRYEIKLGTYEGDEWDDVPSDTDLRASSSPESMAFSIKATSNREVNGSIHVFYDHASTPMVNLSNASRRYYSLDERQDGAAADPLTAPHVFLIAPIGSVSNKESDATMTHSREFAYTGPIRHLYNPTTEPIDSYMFIYSYGSEIDITQP